MNDLNKQQILNIIRMDEEGIDAAPQAEGETQAGYGNENWKKNVWPLISELFSNKSSVIDIGAGNGRRSKFFSDYVSEVVAIDMDSNGRYKNIVSNGIANVKYIQGNFLDYDFGNEKFDVAYCEGSFYWLGHGEVEHNEPFKKIIDILKDDGVLIILEGSWRTHHCEDRRHNLEQIVKDNNCTILAEIAAEWGSNATSLLTTIRKNNDT